MGGNGNEGIPSCKSAWRQALIEAASGNWNKKRSSKQDSPRFQNTMESKWAVSYQLHLAQTIMPLLVCEGFKQNKAVSDVNGWAIIRAYHRPFLSSVTTWNLWRASDETTGSPLRCLNIFLHNMKRSWLEEKEILEVYSNTFPLKSPQPVTHFGPQVTWSRRCGTSRLRPLGPVPWDQRGLGNGTP